MSDSKQPINPSRKFLHDLATPLTIVKHMIKKFKEALASDQPLDKKASLERMEKALKAVEQMEHLHAEHKSEIHKRESA
jgi:hypothetical protein